MVTLGGGKKEEVFNSILLFRPFSIFVLSALFLLNLANLRELIVPSGYLTMSILILSAILLGLILSK